MIEATDSLVGHSDGSLAIKRVTQFSDEFLASLRSERDAKAHLRARDIDRVASVPTHVADIWLRQGFNIYAESPKAIVARLRSENLECFLTSSKSL